MKTFFSDLAIVALVLLAIAFNKTINNKHMTSAVKIVWEARIKSFFWRGGAFLVLAGLNWLSEEIVSWHLPVEWYTVASLLLGELTKYLNSNLPWLRSVSGPNSSM